MGTYTNKWGLYIPDNGERDGWASKINDNFQIISEHLGGKLQELSDISFTRMPLDGDTLHFIDSTKTFDVCRPNEVGKQNHEELGHLDTDSHGIYLMLDGTNHMENPLNMNFFKIINNPDPEDPGDLIPKRYFDIETEALKNAFFAIERGINDPSTILTKQNGDSYIVGISPVDAWTGKANAIAYWMAGVWRYREPLKEGTVIYVNKEHTYYKFNGVDWVLYFLSIPHAQLQGLALDDHTQYLNSIRHNDENLHVIGDTVPHDQLTNLLDVHVESNDVADNDVIIYRVPPTQSGPDGIGYFTNVRRNKVGIQNHNGLWGREDDVNEPDPEEVAGVRLPPSHYYDPSSPDYDPSKKCHPQYLTTPEHNLNTHTFVRFPDLDRIDSVSLQGVFERDIFVYSNGKWVNKQISGLRLLHSEIFDSDVGNPHPQYIPWSTKVNTSVELPKNIQLGGELRFHQTDSYSVTLDAEDQTGNNVIRLPNASGTSMVSKDGQRTKGQVTVYDGVSKYDTISLGQNKYVLMSLGEGVYPTFVDLTNYYDMLPAAAQYSLVSKGVSKWEKLEPPTSTGISTSPYNPSTNPKFGVNDMGVLTYDKTNKLRWANTLVSPLDSLPSTDLQVDDELRIYDKSASRDKKITVGDFFKTKRTIVLTAASAITPPIQGAEVHTSNPENINQLCYPFIQYPASTLKLEADVKMADWFFTMPEAWSPTNPLEVIIYWTPGELPNGVSWNGGDTDGSGSPDTVVFGIKSWRFGAGINLRGESQSFTKISPVSVGSDGQYILRVTPAFTPSFFGDQGLMVGISIARLVTDVSDTYKGSADLISVRIEYTTENLSD